MSRTTAQKLLNLTLIDMVCSGSSTLPRTTTRAIETEGAAGPAGRTDKVAAATSSTSLYDNVATSQPAHQAPPKRKFNVEIIGHKKLLKAM